LDKELHRRVLFVSFLLVAGFSIFSVQLYRIQIGRHEELTEKADKGRLRKFVLPSSRGVIMDRKGERLVYNEPVQHIVANKKHLENKSICVRGVAHAEGISVREARDKYSLEETQRRYVARVSRLISIFLDDGRESLQQIVDARPNLKRIQLAKDLPYDQAQALNKFLASEKIRGIEFDDGMKRVSPNPLLMSNVVGVTGEEKAREGVVVGLAGIEREWEDQLRGIDGYRMVEVGKGEREIAAYRGEEIAPQNGNNVILTIDAGLQAILEEVMDAAVLEYSPERIMAVFTDPMTGGVLAMACRPTYNQQTRMGEMKNLCVSHNYEPGSVFKLITVAAALDGGFVSANTLIDCHSGSYSEPGVSLTDHGSYGDLTPSEILQKSSNIGAYMLAKQIGKHTLYNYTRDFGLGTATRIRLPNENKGLVINPGSTSWSQPTLSVMCMGYSVDVTPLQMANVIGTVANGGNLMRPYVVQSVVGSDGNVVFENEPSVLRRVISERTTDELRKGMILVAGPEGTAKLAAMEYFTVAGKTGTAQKSREDEKGRRNGYYNGDDGGRRRYVVSFGGFLPAENPALSGIIIVDDPKMKDGKPAFGGSVAAPIFKAFAERAMPYLGVEPTKSTSTKRVTRTVRRAAVPVSYQEGERP
jgi:cell division protein FtsI/penicillin-binding protein 2